MIERGKYLLADLLGVAVYGIVLYFMVTWLAGYSLLYAYFGNLALIILFLALEEYSIRAVESKGVSKILARQKDKARAYRLLKRALENNISTKTMLYLFYVFILIFSQVLDSHPGLVGESLGTFISSNSYSILLLIALDMLIRQISKDRKRMKKLTAKLDKSLAETQDQ